MIGALEVEGPMMAALEASGGPRVGVV